MQAGNIQSFPTRSQAASYSPVRRHWSLFGSTFTTWSTQCTTTLLRLVASHQSTHLLRTPERTDDTTQSRRQRTVDQSGLCWHISSEVLRALLVSIKQLGSMPYGIRQGKGVGVNQAFKKLLGFRLLKEIRAW